MANSTFLLLLLALLLPRAVRAQQRNNTNIVLLGSSLSPIKGANSSWLSPSGRFAFGFYPQSDNAFVVAVWFAKIPESTVVWHFTYDNDDKQKQALTVSSNATLIFNTEGSLILRDGQGIKDSIIFSGAASSAAMLESGNFVVYNSKSQIIWQTFNSPTNTILQGQRLENGAQLFSSSIASQNLKGRFRLQMQSDGNLVQYPIRNPDAYWASRTDSEGSSVTLNLNEGGNLYLLNGTGANIKNITDGWNSPTNGTVYRATLDADGIFGLYSHTLEKDGSWSVKWASFDNRCYPRGSCGLNAYCVLMDQVPDCRCIPQFDFINQADKTSDCVRIRKLSYDCRNGTKKEEQMILTMAQVEGISLDSDGIFSTLPSTNVDECKTACLDDCNCDVVRFGANDACTKHKLPLMYAKRNGDLTMTFIKINKDDQNNDNNTEDLNTFTKNGTPIGVKKDRRKEVIAIGAAFLSSSLVVLVISGILRYKKHTTYEKILMNSGAAEEISLRSFQYDELEQATNGFKEEVGRGAFGTVFKGTLPNNNQTIAVKRLDKNLVDEASEKEFQTEMRVIGKTHHKNLVKLLGYCQSGSNHRLLVYEYMSKGSLANFFFNSDHQQTPSWDERLKIALNVARGILYLHEECETQIIHCDIKLQNILMDDSGCAKIGDFGLAKLLKPGQTNTFTGIRGTRGYVAPEWHRNLPVTVKVDVYSFGIVLLEIVCCRRNLDMNRSEDEAVLADWVYECFENGELGKLVSSEDQQQVNMNWFDRAVRVALWCIQDEPSLRPSMKKVVLMLEGTIDIPTPPSPSSFLSSIYP
ncbi:hypothetical protein Syun_013868 [Stephania yunnanensis]|uniref:Receptor-like serine/threonine-protein kinase n=1 Tax=Stephania yunnanensis TaxID=152371 RepID=A0AAP0JJY7_9MAGN